MRASNGTTIQVIHTDAEGRMVLADTLALAARTHPRVTIDFATLTGACVYALTERYSGVFTNRAQLGATLAARRHGIPVLLDGFVCTAAAAPLARLAPGGLDHTQIAHLSAEAGHRRLAAALGKTPLIDFSMRLGEASGAALCVPLLRAAVACLTGMATFADAGVSDRA